MSEIRLGVVQQLVTATSVTVELENVPGYQVGPVPVAELPAPLAVGDTVIVAELGMRGQYVVLAKLATS